MAAVEDLRAVTAAIADVAATGGWQTRAFARRDTAVLVTAWAGGFSCAALAGLFDTDVTSDRDGGLRVLIRASTVRALPYTSDPLTCPPCAMAKWAQVTTAWDAAGRAGLMRLLADRDPEGHVCRVGIELPSAGRPLIRSLHRSGLIRDLPMSGNAVREMIRRRAAEAGLDPDTRGLDGQVPALPPVAVPARRTRGVRPAARSTDSARSGGPARQQHRLGTGENRYTSEQARFTDWCNSRRLTALPADPPTVLSYLESQRPAGGTAARWVAAIRAAHAGAGLPDPCGGSVTAWVRRARSPGADAEEELVRLAGLIPESGWPSGLRGRRDRVAFLLSRLGAVPAAVLAGLPASAVALAGPRSVTVTTAADSVRWVTAAGNDPVLCPACALLRWSQALVVAARFGLIDQLLRRPDGTGHLCEARTECLWPPTWPLLPEINQWGHLPLPPVPAMSVRSVEAMLRGCARGTRTYPPQPPPPKPKKPRRQPAMPSPPPVIPANPDWHKDGIAARARDLAGMGDIGELLVRVEAAAAAAAEQARQILEADPLED